MTEHDESFVRPEPAARYACGALVRGVTRMTRAQRTRTGSYIGANYTYRCLIVPSGEHGVGCCRDHTRQIIAERRLREAIDNAHRSGLSAHKDWEPAEVMPSDVDTHRIYIGKDEAAIARRAATFGDLRPEVEEWEVERKARRMSVYAPKWTHR